MGTTFPMSFPEALAAPAPGAPRRARPWRLRLGLATRLALVVAGLAATALVGIGVLAWGAHEDRSGLMATATTAIATLDQAAARHAELLKRSDFERQQLAAAVEGVQMAFQEQVIAFKARLLRGWRPDQEAAFGKDFERSEAAVRERCAATRRLLDGQAAAVAALDRFLAAHQRLGASYRNAWSMVTLAEDYVEGMRRADDYMVNRDREPIEMLAALVAAAERRNAERIRAAEAEVAAARRQATEGSQAQAADTERAAGRRAGLALAGVVAALTLVGGLALVGIRRSVEPVREAAGVLRAVAAGDLDQRVAVRTGDEVGEMAAALNETVETLARQRDELASGAERQRKLTAGLRQVVAGAAARSSSLAASARSLTDLGRRLDRAAEDGAAGAERTAAGAGAVSTGVAQAAGSAQQVAEAAKSIAQRTAEAAALAAEAAAAVKDIDRILSELDGAGQEIAGSSAAVAKLARATTLLALNATIEAARAGEAGHGFAVVAGEVRDLARSSAQEATGINRRLAGINAASTAVAGSLRRLAALVQRIDEHQQSVAAAAEQQHAATNEMSRTLEEASAAGGRIAAEASASVSAAQATRVAAAETIEAAHQVEEQAKGVAALAAA